MAPDYDHLTLMQKVEVFEHAVNNTAGDDLAKLLWLKSPSSEVGRAGLLPRLCPLFIGYFNFFFFQINFGIILSQSPQKSSTEF